jgi:uncharacterized protein (DUF433 family)
MSNPVKVDREILGGTPCFAGTRVPVKSLFDYLEDGYNIDYFISQFPSVKREQILAVLESSRVSTEAHAKASVS